VSRLADLLDELHPLGRDPVTGGYHRFAWTEVDRQLRAWFTSAAQAEGLDVGADRNGNLWAWWGDPGPGAVVTGSHLDSVPDGGALDGPLGVAAALAAVSELRRRGMSPRRPLAVCVFSDEEGARFGVACVGSRLLAGTLEPAAARALRDPTGVSLATALAAGGVDPDGIGADSARLADVAALVELHLEQGRGLAGGPSAVAVAGAIRAHGRWRLELTGEANHAGTTALADRHDPALAVAAAVLAAREHADALGAVATVGRIRLHPGGVNGIPGRAEVWLDARAEDPAVLTELVAAVTQATRSRAEVDGVGLTVHPESLSPTSTFDAGLSGRLAERLGGAPRQDTGAGHDAGVLAARVPAAMLFVRNPTGVSHAPAETADPADCEAGVTALTDVLEELLG
jgi:N-carbamoyl-L-amino-acid hydrolase